MSSSVNLLYIRGTEDGWRAIPSDLETNIHTVDTIDAACSALKPDGDVDLIVTVDDYGNDAIARLRSCAPGIPLVIAPDGDISAIKHWASRQERDRLDQFASLMSHDLRTPLTVANGYLDIAKNDHDIPELDRVSNAIDRMETLIADMLTLAREGWHMADPEPISLEAASSKAWDIAGSVDATVAVLEDRDIEADPGQLRELLENLFANAVQHGGDQVSVRVGAIPDGFYVADDGGGIPPDARADIFDAGYSTAEDGTGFGLAIVSAIADAHGWTIEVTESEAGGARIAFHHVQQPDIAG